MEIFGSSFCAIEREREIGFKSAMCWSKWDIVCVYTQWSPIYRRGMRTMHRQEERCEAKEWEKNPTKAPSKKELEWEKKWNNTTSNAFCTNSSFTSKRVNWNIPKKGANESKNESNDTARCAWAMYFMLWLVFWFATCTCNTRIRRCTPPSAFLSSEKEKTLFFSISSRSLFICV